MTYKKVTPRVVSKSIKELETTRMLFIYEFIQHIKSIDYFISIDECLITRDTYHKYGWAKKGSSCEYN